MEYYLAIKRNSDKCYKVDESRKHNKRKKLHGKEYILHESFCMKWPEYKNQREIK